jgi:BirA family biotin operon repressor/biotin-[acetyl-CoA-carboxylase] ligase
VNIAPDGFPPALANLATSLQIESGSSELLDRSQIARNVIQTLDRWYGQCLSQGPEAVSTAWSAASEHIGRTMRVDSHSGSFVGRVIDLDLRRGLALETPRSCLEPSADSSANVMDFSLREIVALSDPAAGFEPMDVRSEGSEFQADSAGVEESPARELAVLDT